MTFREVWSILDKKDAEEIEEDHLQKKTKKKENLSPTEIIEITSINRNARYSPIPKVIVHH